MASAVRKTPQEGAAKWLTNLSAAGPEMEAGARRVQESPGVAAARERAKWEARLRETAQKWEDRMRGLSLADWQKAYIDVGVQRVAQGAQAKQNKVVQFNTEFYPFLEQVKQKVGAMPSTTPGQRIAKMVANAEAIRQFKRSASRTGA